MSLSDYLSERVHDWVTAQEVSRIRQAYLEQRILELERNIKNTGDRLNKMLLRREKLLAQIKQLRETDATQKRDTTR